MGEQLGAGADHRSHPVTWDRPHRMPDPENPQISMPRRKYSCYELGNIVTNFHHLFCQVRKAYMKARCPAERGFGGIPVTS
jgi:hypothetical protein